MKILLSVVASATLTMGCAGAQHNDAGLAPNPTLRHDQQEDIGIFRSGFLAVDRAYSPSARAEAERRLSTLERRAGSTPPASFAVEICRIVALADNGHSICHAPGDSIDLSFAPFGDDFFVLKAQPDYADLLGARLLTIDGRSISRIRHAIRSMAGGVPAHRDLLSAPILAKPSLLYALGIAHAAQTATYRLETRDGRIVERQLSTDSHPSSWVNLQSEHPAWASQEINEAFRWRDAPELDAVVIQLRQNADRGDRKIAAFLEEAEDAREQLGRKNIVLDMRWNVGGDFLQTRDFILAWPQRMPTPSRFFILIGPSTFSAGIASVAYLKQAGRDRVILIGEPVGDRLMFFAEGNRPTILPHSRIALLAALQRDDFKDGCRHYNDCAVDLAQPGAAHAPPSETLPPEKLAELERSGRKPLEIHSLEPDKQAPWTMQDFLSGRDPGIDTVAAMAMGKRTND